jgi:hypothetical protein
MCILFATYLYELRSSAVSENISDCSSVDMCVLSMFMLLECNAMSTRGLVGCVLRQLTRKREVLCSLPRQGFILVSLLGI